MKIMVHAMFFVVVPENQMYVNKKNLDKCRIYEQQATYVLV